MDFIFFQPIIDYFSNLSVVRVIDILLVLYLLYELYNLIKGTSGINIFFGIITIYLIWKLVIYLKMPLLSEIMGQFISVGVIAIIIVFQQEIRKFLLLLGHPKFINKTKKRFLFWKFSILQDNTLEIFTLIRAIKYLSANKTGALIVLTRKNELENIINTGIKVDSYLTEQMLESIFYKNAPLHDGAIIITDNRIIAAKCILPVSDKEHIPQNLGLRHRAAIGISEVSDAIAIVVSEQTGKIAVAVMGELRTNVLALDLSEYLEIEFARKQTKK